MARSRVDLLLGRQIQKRFQMDRRSMKMPTLDEFDNYRKLNRNIDFSLYDYLFQVTNQKGLGFDVFIAFKELLWPTFMVHEDYVFLKENFSDNKLANLQEKEAQIEFWMNFLSLDPFFSDEKQGLEQAEFMANQLVTIWSEKLRNDFPSKTFVVKYLHDAEAGDVGLTFYQEKK